MIKNNNNLLLLYDEMLFSSEGNNAFTLFWFLICIYSYISIYILYNLLIFIVYLNSIEEETGSFSAPLCVRYSLPPKFLAFLLCRYYPAYFMIAYCIFILSASALTRGLASQPAVLRNATLFIFKSNFSTEYPHVSSVLIRISQRRYPQHSIILR